MTSTMTSPGTRRRALAAALPALLLLALAFTGAAAAEPPAHQGGGEASLVLPDLSPKSSFLGMNGRSLL